MNKYFNKGLLYQWFNSAKATIFIGLGLWGIVRFFTVNSHFEYVKRDIADFSTNSFMTTGFDEFIILGFIFIAIYFSALGVNNKNTMIFLSSSPYTKKQIKYNELLGLMITMILFVICTIYISVVFYIRNNEVFEIINGYLTAQVIDVAKIILIGTIGILFLLIVNCLFSNSIISSIFTVFVIPECIFVIIVKIEMILRYISVGDGKNIYDKLLEILNKDPEVYTPCILTDRMNVIYISRQQFFIECITALVIIVLLIFVFEIVQRRYKLEDCNKIFSSKLNEKIVLILSSVGLGCFADIILLERIIDRKLYITDVFKPLEGTELLKTFGMELLFISVVAFVTYKLAKMFLKKIE